MYKVSGNVVIKNLFNSLESELKNNTFIISNSLYAQYKKISKPFWKPTDSLLGSLIKMPKRYAVNKKLSIKIKIWEEEERGIWNAEAKNPIMNPKKNAMMLTIRSVLKASR